MKTCFKCRLEKDDLLFVPKTNECKDCKREYRKHYYQDNKEKLLEQAHQYYTDNKDPILGSRKDYYQENKNVLQQNHRTYYQNNKQLFLDINNKNDKRRRKLDPSYAIRRDMATKIRRCLSVNGSSKNNYSIWSYLPYTIFDLKTHVESLFEPWMNWDNRGVYNPKTWDDNNAATWTWNIDHIIPQSDLPYTSMKDDNFKKCWSLDNLRPYLSKQNLIDGVNKVRHKK